MFTLDSKSADLINWFVERASRTTGEAHPNCPNRTVIFEKDLAFAQGKNTSIAKWIETAIFYADSDAIYFMAYSLMIPWLEAEMDRPLRYRLAETAARLEKPALLLLCVFPDSLPAEIDDEARLSASPSIPNPFDSFFDLMEPYRRQWRG